MTAVNRQQYLMVCELNQALVCYFKYVHKVYEPWLTVINQIEVSLNSLTDKNGILELIKVCGDRTGDSADYNDDVDIQMVQQRLMYNILMVINIEMNDISKAVLELNRIIQDLENLFSKVIQVRSKVVMVGEEVEPLLKGSHYQPKLNTLMEWLAYSHEYFKKLYHSINCEIKSQNYNNKESIDKLRTVISKTDRESKRMKEILAFTQFMGSEKTTHLPIVSKIDPSASLGTA